MKTLFEADIIFSLQKSGKFVSRFASGTHKKKNKIVMDIPNFINTSDCTILAVGEDQEEEEQDKMTCKYLSRGVALDDNVISCSGLMISVQSGHNVPVNTNVFVSLQ